jgi:hypothetical protein
MAAANIPSIMSLSVFVGACPQEILGLEGFEREHATIDKVETRRWEVVNASSHLVDGAIDRPIAPWATESVVAVSTTDPRV